MAKIIKFPAPETKVFEALGITKIFVDYEPSSTCCNDESYGCLCIKCGRCGRKFEDGFLQNGGAE